MTEILIIIASTLVVAIVPIMAYLYCTYSKKIFVCNECGIHIKKKWYKMLFISHFNDEVWIKCPNCGSKSLNPLMNEKRNIND